MYFQPFSLCMSLIVRCVSCSNRLLDLSFWSNLTIWLLMEELRLFRIMIWRCLHVLIFLYFFQIKSHVDCSLLLGFLNFSFCWFSELFILAVSLALKGSSIPLQFYSFLASYICDYFSLFSMCIIPLSTFVMQVSWIWLLYRVVLLDKVFLVDSYSLSDLELYCSMLSWLLGFVLRSLRWIFWVYLSMWAGNFYLEAFSILPLFSRFGILILMCCGFSFLIRSIWSLKCLMYMAVYIVIYIWEIFCYNFIE
jgi:hypothetical protein